LPRRMSPLSTRGRRAALSPAGAGCGVLGWVFIVNLNTNENGSYYLVI